MEMTDVKEVINYYSELVNEFIGMIGDNTIDMEIEAARVAGARETDNPKSEKIHLAKLDQLIDNFKEQCIDACIVNVKTILLQNEMLDEENISEFDKTMEFARGLCYEWSGAMMDWYREIIIKTSTMAIDAAYHPKKVAAEKRELNAMKAQFKALNYSFIESLINKGIVFIKEMGEEIPEEANEVIDYVLEICEDNVTDLRSQASGKVKVNPIVRNADEVKKIAEETTQELQEIKEEAKEFDPDDFLEVKPEEKPLPGYGVPKKSFMEMSKYFQN